MLDMQAAYSGDPAAHSYEEIILCYPGILAINVHRLANYMVFISTYEISSKRQQDGRLLRIGWK